VDKGDYVRERVVIRTGPHTAMPVYLLIPKGGRAPRPAVVAFHGHGYGAKDVVGLWEDGSERDTPDGYHQDFGIALCRRGFVVAVPELSCFGERQTDFAHLERAGAPVPTCCTHAAMLAFHLGGSVVGMRVLDGKRLVDWLGTRPEVDRARIGAMGISGGGMHTLFSVALDPRLKACVISGYFSTMRGSVLAMHHCACNVVPGLHAFGEMADLIGLVAPRPVLIESGTHDIIFPIAEARAGVAAARRVYRVFGADDAVRTDFFEGRHRINGLRAYDFLVDRLRPAAIA
jgi:dienelactone hydrolase